MRVTSTATVVMVRATRCTPTETSTMETGSKAVAMGTEFSDAPMEPLMRWLRLLKAHHKIISV